MNPQTTFHILSFWWLFIIALAIACYRLILRLFGVVLIPQSSVGIVDNGMPCLRRTAHCRRVRLWRSTVKLECKLIR